MSLELDRISIEWLKSVGFKKQKCEVKCYGIGKPHCTLYLFEGYSAGRDDHDWWACAAKYHDADTAAARCAHFDKRLNTKDDVRLLASALGIPLKESP